ncbi:hypothetical protein Dsin_005192 [Dipteronia sinensis]|uniref:Uncharacterized protein n=1 Tax=Dipteronia sinensis TaxID=43782 RepID=A0AAE0AX07_9ROSI|nr:hypothetical protein Dsin_005192 [Dipteronia sinensis]
MLRLRNFAKSVLCFSKHLAVSDMNDMANLLGVQVVECHVKYLGLPSFIERNRHRLFANIKERVWNKLKGWKCLLFSFGGKGGASESCNSSHSYLRYESF